MQSDSAARSCAVASIMQVLDHRDAAGYHLILRTLFPNWPERVANSRVPSGLKDEVRQTVALVLDDLIAAIYSAKGSEVPLYFGRFADRWARAALNIDEKLALLREETLRDILLADLRICARRPRFLSMVNSIVEELNNEPIDLLIDAFGVVSWALQRARPAPDRLSIWVRTLHGLYIPKVAGGGTLVAEHPEYSQRRKEFSKNGPTHVRLIADFANLMAKQLDAEHCDIRALQETNVDRVSLWAQAFSRDLARPSKNDKDRYWAPFWDVRDSPKLHSLIDDIRNKVLRVGVRNDCVRLFDPQGRLADDDEASILECLIMVHFRCYNSVLSISSKDT